MFKWPAGLNNNHNDNDNAYFLYLFLINISSGAAHFVLILVMSVVKLVCTPLSNVNRVLKNV